MLRHLQVLLQKRTAQERQRELQARVRPVQVLREPVPMLQARVRPVQVPREQVPVLREQVRPVLLQARVRPVQVLRVLQQAQVQQVLTD